MHEPLRKKIQEYSFLMSDQIGRGFSSTVYRACNDRTGQTVSIKVILLKSLKDHVSHQMLANELACLKVIEHENLLRYINSYSTVNNCYIVTEYCDEGDLEKLIRIKNRLSQTEMYPLFCQIFSGYKALYKFGFIHRDLKPANIFLRNGIAKIADFGFIKSKNTNPQDPYNVGTPMYMAPQSLFNNVYTEKSDIWSLGAILYELITGKTLWQGKSEKQLKTEISRQKFTFEKQISISNELKDLITRCIVKNPTERIGISQIDHHPWLIKAQSYINNKVVEEKELRCKSIKNEKRVYESMQKIQNNSNKYIIIDNNKQNKKNNSIKKQKQIQNSKQKQKQNFQQIQNNKQQQIIIKNSKILPSKYNLITSMKQLINIKNNNNNNKIKSITMKFTTLQYLVGIINYLRFIHSFNQSLSSLYNNIQCSSLFQQNKNLKETYELIQYWLKFELLTCLKQHDKAVNEKSNIFHLDKWDQFINSHQKWMAYTLVIRQYSSKYRQFYSFQNLKFEINQSQDYNRQKTITMAKQIIQNIDCFNQNEILLQKYFKQFISLQHTKDLISNQGWNIIIDKNIFIDNNILASY